MKLNLRKLLHCYCMSNFHSPFNVVPYSTNFLLNQGLHSAVGKRNMFFNYFINVIFYERFSLDIVPWKNGIIFKSHNFACLCCDESLGIVDHHEF